MHRVKYSIDPKHALSVLSTNLFSDSSSFVVELVSNAIDAIGPGLRTDRRRVDITVTKIIGQAGVISIRDHGCGMTKETMENVLPVFFGTTKKTQDMDKIGRFGCGLYASLCYATDLTVRSCSDGEALATKVTFEQSGITLDSSTWLGPGTEVTVVLSSDAPKTVTDQIRLASLIRSVFPFSPVDIYMNGLVVAGPACFDLPWLEARGSGTWSPFATRSEEGTPSAEIVRTIRRQEGTADFALLLTKAPIPEGEPGIRLFVRRVRVGSFYTPMCDPHVARFVAGAVNSRRAEVSLARDSVRSDHPAMRELDELFLKVLGDGMAKWARESPIAFDRFVQENRSHILQSCAASEELRSRIQSHLKFQTAKGEWQAMSVAEDAGCGYFAHHVRQLGGLSADSRLSGPVFLFETTAEHAFLQRLREGSLPGVQWKRIDEVHKTPSGGQLFFRAQQAQAALRLLHSTTRTGDLSNAGLTGALQSARSKVHRVEVVDHARDERAAWLVPVLREGLVEEENQAHSRRAVLAEGRYVASHPSFEAEVRQKANEDGCDKVLYLNYGHSVISALFGVLGSPRAGDQRLAAFLLAGVLSLARNESFEDWAAWHTDFRDNAAQSLNLIVLVLSQHKVLTTGRVADEDRRH